jgi:hypothetical protein
MKICIKINDKSNYELYIEHYILNSNENGKQLGNIKDIS